MDNKLPLPRLSMINQEEIMEERQKKPTENNFLPAYKIRLIVI
jgi:hypothetical protein